MELSVLWQRHVAYKYSSYLDGPAKELTAVIATHNGMYFLARKTTNRRFLEIRTGTKRIYVFTNY